MNTVRTPPHGFSTSDPNISRSVNNQPMLQSNVTTRGNSKRARLHEDDGNSFDLFREEIKEMISDWISQQNLRLGNLEKNLSQLNEHSCGIKASNNGIEKSLEDISIQMKDLDRKMDMLEGERKNTRAKIAELEERSESLERFVRKTSIEIRGVPKKKKERKEELLSMVTSLIKTTGIEYSPYDIKDIYRLPSKENATTSTIVTEFSNNFFKEKFLSSAKQFNSTQRGRQLNTRHLGLDGPEMTLFISEHLTPKAKRLHFLARDFARTEQFQYCWIANGRVFLRKKEGEKYTVVKNENTFQQLRGMYGSNN